MASVVDQVLGPGDHVSDAGLDVLVTARAGVRLDGADPWNPHHLVPIELWEERIWPARREHHASIPVRMSSHTNPASSPRQVSLTTS